MTVTDEAVIDLTADDVAGDLRLIGLDLLRPADDNVRRDLGDLTELAESIRAQGVLQPLLVNDAGDGTFLIVAGHRRHGAARLAGRVAVPCMVRSLDEIARVEAMIVENIQRSGLTPLEEASAYHRLTELTGLGQRAIGTRLGRSQAHVSKRLALLDLPDTAQEALDAGELTLEGAQALTRLKEHPARVAEVLKMLKGSHQNWSVARVVDIQLEEAAAQAKIAAAIAALPKGTRHQTCGHFDTYSQKWRELGTGDGKVGLTAAKHRSKTCHVVVVDARAKAHVCCDNPRSHPEYKPPYWERPANRGGAQGAAGPGLTEKEKRERAESRRRKKALRAAEEARLPHLKAIAVSGDASRLAEDLTAAMLEYGSAPDGRRWALACELLGLQPKKGGYQADHRVPLRDAPPAAAGLALLLAIGEAEVRCDYGNWSTPSVAALYRRLKAAGYQPCPDEEAALKKAHAAPARGGA